MVVDDSVYAQNVVRRTLARLGMRVLCVGSYADAQRVLSAEPIDVAVLDICLPGLSGLDLLYWIRRWNETLPVLLHSGKQCPLRLNQADIHLSFMSKPYQPSDLQREVQALLNGKPKTGVKHRLPAAPQGIQCPKSCTEECQNRAVIHGGLSSGDPQSVG